MRMTVIGTGYLGATHAACMAELGHEVIGVDVDEAKIASLRDGKVPFFEPGLPEVLERNLENGRLSFSTSYGDAAGFAHVHFLAVGTPQKRGSFAADLSYVRQVITSLVPLLEGDHIPILHRQGRGDADLAAGRCAVDLQFISVTPIGQAGGMGTQTAGADIQIDGVNIQSVLGG